jgi:uncharacterized membrane protein (DUF373 family)
VATQPREKREIPRRAAFGNALLALVEDVIYVGIATLLAVSAVALLINAAWSLTDLGDTDTSELVLEILDLLLLVFIVVELLFAVRVTLRKRELVAEPFLVVGIIASIKEIIVLSVEAADLLGKGEAFDHAMIEVAVLGVLVLLLAGSAVLLRAKERDPEEGEGDVVDQDRIREG